MTIEELAIYIVFASYQYPLDIYLAWMLVLGAILFPVVIVAADKMAKA